MQGEAAEISKFDQERQKSGGDIGIWLFGYGDHKGGFKLALTEKYP
jgi:hypothetical protein